MVDSTRGRKTMKGLGTLRTSPYNFEGICFALPWFAICFQVSRTSSLASLMFKDDGGMEGQADFKRRHVDGEVRKTVAVRVGRFDCPLVVYHFQRSSSRYHRRKRYLLRVQDALVASIMTRSLNHVNTHPRRSH